MTVPSLSARCPACDWPAMVEFFRLASVPVLCNALHDTREQALGAPRAELRLGACPHCEMIANIAFDPARLQYDARYENALHFSGSFRDYERRLIEELGASWRLSGRCVLEIGCGDRHFLRELCGKHDCRGIGFDPSFRPESHPAENEQGVRIERRLFDPELVGEPVDTIICRHVLEHIDRPREFLQQLAQLTPGSDGLAVYLEVPHADCTFAKGGIWDLLYEHCSYFNGESLTGLLQCEGWRVDRCQEAFAGQYLQMFAHREGTPAEFSATSERPDATELTETLPSHLADFSAAFATRCDRWSRWITARQGQGKRVVVWGAGTKGINFLNFVAAAQQVEFIVDINPRKTDRYVPVTGQQVVRPDRLQSIRPDCVLLMNPVYADEVRRQLAELRIPAELVVVD